MSDERRNIALRALRAAGHDQAADLVEAIIPATPVEAEAPAPAAAVAPAAAAAAPAEVVGPQPPAGKAPLLTQADVEALSQAEYEARYGEVQAVLGEAG